MTNAVLAEPLTASPSTDWRTALELVARREWKLMQCHPWLAPQLHATRARCTQNELDRSQCVMRALADSVLTASEKLELDLVLRAFVRGMAELVNRESGRGGHRLQRGCVSTRVECGARSIVRRRTSCSLGRSPLRAEGAVRSRRGATVRGRTLADVRWRRDRCFTHKSCSIVLPHGLTQPMSFRVGNCRLHVPHSFIHCSITGCAERVRANEDPSGAKQKSCAT